MIVGFVIAAIAAAIYGAFVVLVLRTFAVCTRAEVD